MIEKTKTMVEKKYTVYCIPGNGFRTYAIVQFKSKTAVENYVRELNACMPNRKYKIRIMPVNPLRRVWTKRGSRQVGIKQAQF